MRLDRVKTERTPLVPSKLVTRRRFGMLMPAAIIATLLAVSSPAHTSAAPVNLSTTHLAHRAQTTLVQRTIALQPPSADVFMHALITQNGQLAWQQLCPALQAKLPASVLATLVYGQGSDSIYQGAQLGVDVVGSHPWALGGAIHVYVVTAHWPSGRDVRTLFVLRTQASGCIDGILGT